MLDWSRCSNAQIALRGALPRVEEERLAAAHARRTGIDPFVIRLDNFDFAPQALVRRGKLWGTVVKRLAGDEGCPGYLVRLAEPITTLQGWRPRRIDHLLVCPRDPSDELTPTSYNVAVEISYALDPGLARAEQFRPEQADYVALGRASAGITE